MSGPKKTNPISTFLESLGKKDSPKSGYENIVKPFTTPVATLDNEELASKENTDNISPEVLDFLKTSDNERKAISYAQSTEAREIAELNKKKLEDDANTIADLDKKEKTLLEDKNNLVVEATLENGLVKATNTLDPYKDLKPKVTASIPKLTSEAQEQVAMIREQKKQLALQNKENTALQTITDEITKLEEPFKWDKATTDTGFFSNPLKWIDESISNTFANVHNTFTNPEKQMKSEDKAKYQALIKKRDIFYKPIAEAKAYDWELIAMNLDMQLSEGELSITDASQLKNLRDQALDSKRELEAYLSGEDGSDNFFRKLGEVSVRTNELGVVRPYSDITNNIADFFYKDNLYNKANEQGYDSLSDHEKSLLEVYAKIEEDKSFLADKQKWSYGSVDGTMHSVGFIRDMMVGEGIVRGAGSLVGLGEGTALKVGTAAMKATGSKIAGRVAIGANKAGSLAASYAVQNQLNPQFINQELMKGSHIEKDDQGNIKNIYVKDKLYDYMSEVYRQTEISYRKEMSDLLLKGNLTSNERDLGYKSKLTSEELARLEYLEIKLGEKNSMAEHSLAEELETFKPKSLIQAEVLGFAHTSTENLAELYGAKIIGGIGKGLSKIPGVNKLTTGVGKLADKINYKMTNTLAGRFYKNLGNATGKLNVAGTRVIGSIPEEIGEEYVTAAMNSVIAADPKEFIDMFEVQANIDIAAQTLLMSAGFGLGGNVQTHTKLGYNKLISKRIADLEVENKEALSRIPKLDLILQKQKQTLATLEKDTPEYKALKSEIEELETEKFEATEISNKLASMKSNPSFTGLGIMRNIPGVTDATFSGTKNYIESRKAIRQKIDALKSNVTDESLKDILNLNSMEGFGIADQKLKIKSLRAQGKVEAANIAEKALFQNVVLQSFRSDTHNELSKALDKLQDSTLISPETKLQVIQAKSQLTSLQKTYEVNKKKPNLSNIMTLAMEKLSAKEGIVELENDQNKISEEVRQEIDAFIASDSSFGLIDYSLETLYTREFTDQAEQDKYDTFLEKLSNYNSPIIEAYLDLHTAKENLKAHLNHTSVALNETMHPSQNTINKQNFLEAIDKDYNAIIEGTREVINTQAEFNYRNEFKATKSFIQELFDNRKKEWVGTTNEGKISIQEFEKLREKAIFNVTRQLEIEKIIKAQQAQQNTTQAQPQEEPVVEDEEIVIVDDAGQEEFINFTADVEQDTMIFFEDPSNSGPIISTEDLDDMLGEESYTPEQLAFVKKAMSDIVARIQEITGQEQVSFKEAISQYYKYFQNKEALRTNFRHFVKGWKLNNLEVTNAEVLNAYDSLFLKEEDIMKVEDGIQNLFNKTISRTEIPVIALEDQVTETQEAIAQNILYPVTYDEENLPVVQGAIEEVKTQRTVNILPKVGFNAISYEEVIEDGVLVKKSVSSTLNLLEGDLIDFRDLINPDMYYSGTSLNIEVVNESLWSEIKVSNGRNDKGEIQVTPFASWVMEREAKNPDFRSTKEFKDKQPIFFTDAKGKRLAYVQDVDWYNPFNISNPYGESTNPSMPTEQWLNHIQEGKDNTSKFRQNISQGLKTVTVERLNAEGVFHKLLAEEPLISLQESNPQSIVVVQRGETLENLPKEFSTGESVLLNKATDFDLNKTNGHTWAIYRIGTAKNDKGDLVKTYRAFPINRQVTLDQVENVRWALAAFSAYSGNTLPSQYRMTKEQALENFIKPISKATGINISDVKGVMEYVKTYFQLTPTAMYNLRRPIDKREYNADSVVLYLRLLLEDNTRLNDPSVVDLFSQHTNSKYVKTKNGSVELSKEGVASRLRNGKAITYADYLKDTLLINIKSFNVGTESAPVYATVVQPIINVSYSEIQAENTQTLEEKITQASQEAIAEITSESPTLTEHIDFLNSIGVDLENFENFDELIENVEAFQNLFNLTGNLNVVQEKTVRQFLVHAIGEKINLDYKTKIRKEKVSAEVKSELNLQLRKVQQKIETLSKDLQIPEDKKALVAAAYQSILENIQSIQDNFSEIFDKAFEDIKKQTQLTEIEEIETEAVENEESLTVKDYSKESIEEGGKNKASYRLRRFLHKIPRYTAEGKIVTGYLGLVEYMTFNEVYNELTKVLSLGSEIVSDYKIILDKLKKSESPFIKDVIAKLETADQQIKNELVYNFVRHSLSSKFGMFESSTKGSSLKVYDTNANEVSRIILNKWINESKASDLYARNGNFNSEYAKVLLEEFKSFDLDINKVDAKALRNWLEKVGMYVHPKTWDTIYNKGLFNGNKQYTFKELYSLNKGGLFVPITKFLEKGIKNPEDFSFTKDNQAFSDLKGVTNAIASVEANFNPQLIALSFRDSGKNISTQVPTKFFTDKVEELKRSLNGENSLIADLQSLSFSENALMLQLLSNDPNFKTHLEASHISLTAFKERGRNPSKAGLTDLGDLDFDMLTLTGFMDRKVGNLSEETKIDGISVRLAHMVSPTMSDKSTGLLMKTGVLDLLRDSALLFNTSETGEISLDSSLKEVLFKFLVLPELKRIVNFHSKVKTTNIKNYDKAATLFHLFPVLNTLQGTEDMSIVEELAVTEGYPLEFIIEKYQGIFEDAIEKVIKAEVNHKKDLWKPYAVTNEKGTTSEMFDTNYFKEGGKLVEENYDIAIFDYVINTMLFNADIFKIFAGDIANYSQDKVFKGEDNIYDIQDPTKYISINKQIGVNLGKRLALLIAPGSKMANSYGEKYNQIMLQDSVDISENSRFLIKMYYGEDALDFAQPLLDKYKKASDILHKVGQGSFYISPENLDRVHQMMTEVRKNLSQAYPKIDAYFDIESTDAQEYTTASEHIENTYRMGRLSDSQYQAILNKINTNTPLNKSELKIVMQPMKPVYTGNHINKEWDVNRMIYIKSSSFPLLPQFTAGTELDALRIKMEELESKTGRFTRASFQTANKVGATKNTVNPFDVNSLEKIKEYKDTDVDSTVLILDRNNFRNQQDVPFKSDKESDDKISMGTQFFKLLFGDGVVNSTGFILDGKEHTGRELYEKYSEAFETIVNSKKQQLFLDLGLSEKGEITNQAMFMAKLQELLQKEATERGYSIKSLRGLKIEKLVAKAGYYYEFKTPLWLSSDSNRYESLLNSIITNRVMKHKMPGNSFVAGSESGLRMTEDLSKINKSEVVYLNSWNGVELQGTKNEEGTFSKAQVLAPSKFKSNGKLIDLFEGYTEGNKQGKYLIKKNGKLALKDGMIAQELLNTFSFRTPTSSHVSGASIEIVGFLPAEMGDLMIVPKNFTKQKGLDFDVDKENTYQLNHVVNEDGTIEVLNQKHKTEALKALEFIIEKLDLENVILDKKGSLRTELFNLSKGKGNFFSEESLEELLVPEISIKEKLKRKTLEFDRKLAENTFIKTHLAVFNNPNEEVQSKINKVLSMEFAGNQAATIENLNEEGKKNAQIKKYISEDPSLSLLDAEKKYKEESLNFNMLTYSYQKEKMSLGSIGKIAIGVYANYTTFNGLVQQSFAQQFIPEDKGDGPIPKRLRIGLYTSSGTLGEEYTLEGSRTIAEVFAEKENTATDNEKEQILGRVGVDEFTINTDALMTLRGFDKDENGNSIPYMLLSQPIVKRLNTIRKNSKGVLGEFKKDEEIINDILFELSNGELTWYDGKAVYSNSVSIEAILSKIPPIPYEINGGILNGNALLEGISNNGLDLEIQLEAFLTYLEVEKEGRAISKIQKTINVNTLGKSIIESQLKYEGLKELANSPGLVGADSLLGHFIPITEDSVLPEGYTQIGEFYVKPTTPQGQIVINGLHIGNTLFNDFFPYQQTSITSVVKEILAAQDKLEISDSVMVDQFETVIEEIRKYYYSREDNNIFEGQPRDVRAELFKDTTENTSLSTYVKDLFKGEVIEFGKGIKGVRNNALIKAFNFETGKGTNELSLIRFNNAATDNLDEESLYNAIPELILLNAKLPNRNGKEYTTKDLAMDLVNYAFLEGGVQEANQFIKFVPVEYLESVGKYEDIKFYKNGEIVTESRFVPANRKFQEFNAQRNPRVFADSFEFNENGPSTFTKQFFQHNPEKAIRTNYKEIQNNNLKAGTFTLKDSSKPPLFLSLTNPKSSVDKFSLYQHIGNGNYTKLNLLGQMGISEYDYKNSTAASLRDLEVPVVEPIIGDRKVEIKSLEVTEKTTIKDLLTQISEVTLTPEYAHLSEAAKVLAPFAKDIGELQVTTEIPGAGRAIKTGNILLHSSIAFSSNEKLAMTFIHEFIHTISRNELDKYFDAKGLTLRTDVTIPSYVTNLYTVFSKFRTLHKAEIEALESKIKGNTDNTLGIQYSEREKDLIYAGANIREFLSVALTSPLFQEEMSKVEYGKSGQSFLQKIADFIMDLLSKTYPSIKKDSLAYEAVKQSISFIAEENANKIKESVNQIVQQTENLDFGDIGIGNIDSSSEIDNPPDMDFSENNPTGPTDFDLSIDNVEDIPQEILTLPDCI